MGLPPLVRRSLFGAREAALYVLRRVLPRRAKRFLKRFWDPNQVISAEETLLLGDELFEGGALSSIVGSSKGTTRVDIICFSIIDWDFRWQRPQQIMSEFANQGHRVFFLSTTRFVISRKKRYAARPVRENVWEVQLGTPRSLDVYGGRMAPEAFRAFENDLQQLRLDFNISSAVSVVQVATWARCAFRMRDVLGWPVIYDCMDEWNTFPGMRSELLEEERTLVEQCDLLVVSGQRLWDKYSVINDNIVLARNASDFEHFHRPPVNDLLSDVPGPIVGYFGAIADWFDLPLMLKLARARPQYTFVLLGGVFEVSVTELKSLPNVRVLGQKPYALMPAYLQHFDVCLIPFKVNAITEATDPVKFYEYVSQGKPVVAAAMPELYPYRDYLYIANDHDDFIAKVDAAVAEKGEELAQRRVALAAENTWKLRVERIEEQIPSLFPPASVIVVTFNNLQFNRLCLESIFRNTVYPNLEIIAVDNGSTDGTREYLQQVATDHSNLKVILNDENQGFARANNQGLAAAEGEYLILLNNDTVVPNGWLGKLARHLRDPQFGLVNTVTNFSGNESRIPVDYKDMSGMEEFAERYTREHDGKWFDIRVAAMYCVGFRRDVFEKVGPLDEQFGMGMFEDDDYSHRVRLGGYRVVCVEDCFVHHFGQASFKKLSQQDYQAIWDRNQKYYEEKWSLPWKPHTLRKPGE